MINKIRTIYFELVYGIYVNFIWRYFKDYNLSLKEVTVLYKGYIKKPLRS